jgi:hypothetical protein
MNTVAVHLKTASAEVALGHRSEIFSTTKALGEGKNCDIDMTETTREISPK